MLHRQFHDVTPQPCLDTKENNSMTPSCNDPTAHQQGAQETCQGICEEPVTCGSTRIGWNRKRNLVIAVNRTRQQPKATNEGTQNKDDAASTANRDHSVLYAICQLLYTVPSTKDESANMTTNGTCGPRLGHCRWRCSQVSPARARCVPVVHLTDNTNVSAACIQDVHVHHKPPRPR